MNFFSSKIYKYKLLYLNMSSPYMSHTLTLNDKYSNGNEKNFINIIEKQVCNHNYCNDNLNCQLNKKCQYPYECKEGDKDHNKKCKYNKLKTIYIHH